MNMTENFHKLFKALFLTCLLLVSTQAAAQCSSPCCPVYDSSSEPECFCKFPNFNPCCQGFGGEMLITAEFLWWRPCFDNLDYAVKTEKEGFLDEVIFENNSYRHIDHEWMPGLRVGLELDNIYCDWDLRFNYTWFPGKNTKESSGSLGTIQPTLFHPGVIDFLDSFEEITASHRFQYHNFELQFGQTFELSPCHEVFPFFGVHGVLLEQVIQSEGIEDGETRARARWESGYQAMGLQIGGDYHYRLQSNLEFFAYGAFSVIAGCNKISNRQDNIAFDGEMDLSRVVFFRNQEGICTPGLHLKAGANYTLETCGQELMLTIGYEFIQWFNMPQVRRFLSDNASNIGLSTTPNGSRIGFHGLFLGSGFSF
jgi:hypothetical protein